MVGLIFGSEFAWNNAEYDSSQEHIETDAMCKSVDIDIRNCGKNSNNSKIVFIVFIIVTYIFRICNPKHAKTRTKYLLWNSDSSEFFSPHESIALLKCFCFMRGKKTFHAINWNKNKNNTKSKMIDPKQQENTLPILMHLIVEEKKILCWIRSKRFVKPKSNPIHGLYIQHLFLTLTHCP